MSVEQLDVIDDVHVAGDGGPVFLTIVDPLDWSDSLAHQTALQKKFNVYLSFVESGELNKLYPRSALSPVTIHIAFKFGPGEQDLQFLNDTKEALASAGLGFSYEVLRNPD
jgi:hypothetical protein